MIVHVLACDYDGTIAEHGRVAEATAAALARVRQSGRKVFLVTGRLLPDLRRACPEADRMFDAIVVENGAVLYLPDRRDVRVLGEAPEPALVDALRAGGVPFELGDSLVATDDRFSDAALAAIRDTGVERTLVFNKGSLMLLPGGVTKGTGLTAALAALELSPHNVAGIGDAENDHAFLSMCECAVAVADAIPALRERADHVTRENGGRGVVEFIEEHVLRDLVDLVPRLPRHHLRLGQTAAGVPVTVPAHRTTMLIVGPSSTGKSTLTGVLIEQAVAAGRSLCVIDPEGDYEGLAALEGMVVLGGTADHQLPAPDELNQLLRRPKAGLVLNLSTMTRAEKVEYGTKALATVAAVRSTTGMPHWLVVDEAHHLFPADGSTAVTALQETIGAVCLITLTVGDLAPDLRRIADVVASTDLEEYRTALASVLGGQAPPNLAPSGGALEPGEAALGWLSDSAPPGAHGRAARFRVDRRAIEHRRHVRKYVEDGPR